MVYDLIPSSVLCVLADSCDLIVSIIVIIIRTLLLSLPVGLLIVIVLWVSVE